LIAAILGCVIFLLFNVYRYYGARGKTVRIRFIQDRSRTDQSSSHHGYDGSGQGKALLESGDVSTTILLNNKMNLNLLIVYSHDSNEHDAAVLALADFLRDVFNFDVHVSFKENFDYEFEFLRKSSAREVLFGNFCNFQNVYFYAKIEF
jgi:hypothetical protein